MRCSPARRATRSSPRSCWRPCGPAPASCRPPSGTYSAVGWRRCPSRPGRCLQLSRWAAGRCPTGCWPPPLAWTSGGWSRRCARRSPLSCWGAGRGRTATRSATPCCGRLLRPTCCRASGHGCTPATPTPSPGGPSWLPVTRPRWPPPRWLPIGTLPGSPPGRCRPGSRPGCPPSAPAASPRPTSTMSVPSRCGSGSPTLAGQQGWTGSTCWPGPPRRPPWPARSSARPGDHRGTTRDEPGALAAYADAERLLAGAPPSAEHARVLASHALTLTQLGWRSPKAIQYCEQAIRIARAAGARAEEAHALATLGMCLDDLNQLDRAIALQLEARRIAEGVGDTETVIRTYATLSHSLVAAGRDREALDDAHQGYQRARQLGLQRAMGSYVASDLARRLLASGRWEDCERLTREALCGDSWADRGLHATRGRLLARQGDFAAAREQLRLALRLSLPLTRDDAWLGLAE